MIQFEKLNTSDHLYLGLALIICVLIFGKANEYNRIQQEIAERAEHRRVESILHDAAEYTEHLRQSPRIVYLGCANGVVLIHDRDMDRLYYIYCNNGTHQHFTEEYIMNNGHGTQLPEWKTTGVIAVH